MEGYALFRGLCAISKNPYAGSYARIMRMILCGIPLDVDTVCLKPVCLHLFLLGPCKLLKWLLQRSRSGSLLIHPHHSEALLIAIELRDVKRGYAQAYAHNPGLHKLHKGYDLFFVTCFPFNTVVRT